MSAFIEFFCPHCKESIRTSAQYSGKQGACPHCGKTVTVEAAEQDVNLQAAGKTTLASSGTDSNPLIAASIGVVATGVLYAVMFVAHSTYVGQLFTERGPIPSIATFVTFWGLAILALKFIAVKHQLSFAENELDMMPLETGMQINPRNVQMFLEHVNGMPEGARNSILGRRIHGALEHFQARNSVPEVQSYLSAHAEINASGVESGYTLLKAFIWVVPILGFIGTVMGISKAVRGLDESLNLQGPAAASAPADLDAAAMDGDANLGSRMMGGMRKVTQGLATAFDTTFLCLVMAIILLFPTELLKKTEFAMLDRIEVFTQESLIRRMTDETSEAPMIPEIAAMLEPAFRRHQQWLIDWQNQVSQLGRVIGEQFETHAKRIKATLDQVLDAKTDETVTVIQSCTSIVEQMIQAIAELNRVSTSGASDWRSALSAAQELQQQIAENTESMNLLATRMGSTTGASANVSDHLMSAVESLNGGVDRLIQIVSQDQPAATEPESNAMPRRGIWPFGRKH